MSHETQYLPGTIRDRIQDLMKSRKISQANLATRIGCSESTLSRFISGKTDKLGNENIIRIARAFEVSTDFLLGVVDEPDRKNSMPLWTGSHNGSRHICCTGLALPTTRNIL